MRWLIPRSRRQRVADVVDELAAQRLVEPVVGAQLLDLLRRRLRQPRQLRRRVAHHPEEEEVEDEHEDERQQRRPDLARRASGAFIAAAPHASSSSGSRPSAAARAPRRGSAATANTTAAIATTPPGPPRRRLRRCALRRRQREQRLVGDLLADDVAGLGRDRRARRPRPRRCGTPAGCGSSVRTTYGTSSCVIATISWITALRSSTSNMPDCSSNSRSYSGFE